MNEWKFHLAVSTQNSVGIQTFNSDDNNKIVIKCEPLEYISELSMLYKEEKKKKKKARTEQQQ